MKKLIWITERETLILHDRLIALHGGAPGIRDQGLLKSALARPQQILAYGESPDVMAMAAAYTSGIVNNHPFIDGNKRTGFLIGALFLEVNGYRLTASEEDAANAVLGMAASTLNESEYAAFLRANVRRNKK